MYWNDLEMCQCLTNDTLQKLDEDIEDNSYDEFKYDMGSV